MRYTLLLIGSLPPPYHGSSLYLKNLHSILKNDNEYEVIKIDTSDRRNDISNLGALNISNIFAALSSICKVLCIAISKRPHFVYIPISQNALAFLRDGIFILISHFFKKKIIIHLHGSYFLTFYSKTNYLNRKFIDYTIRCTTGAIVLGETLRPIFYKWIDKSKIFVLPNFIFRNKSISSSRENNKLIITYLSNIYRSKGIFDLLDAFEKILLVNNNIYLEIVGKIGFDPITKESEAKITKEFNERIRLLGAFVKYHGQISNEVEKNKVLSETNIFILPSWNEGQPLVILEAMAAGCPIISTKNVGVIDETVIDGFNGILIEPKNVLQLLKAIEILINNNELREKMGINSQIRFNEKYTEVVHLNRFKKILGQL